MPTASDELRAKMDAYFGDPISEMGAMNYLQDQGYKLGRDWVYRKDGMNWEDLPEKDRECICFLADEWDFGGFADADRT